MHEEKRETYTDSHKPVDEDDNTPSVPPPLNIPPSRARRQLAARLAQRKKEAVAAETDPDAADHAALETASHLPEDPGETMDFGSAAEHDMGEAGLQITGLSHVTGASRFSGLFGSDDSSSSDEGHEEDFDEDEAGRDMTIGRPEGDFEQGTNAAGAGGGLGRRRSARKDRRPSTTEAKERRPLDDEDDDDEEEDGAGARHPGRGNMLLDGEGPFADPVDVDDDDSSEEDELVEIRQPRRTS